MKKKLLSVVSALMVMMVFVSCSKDGPAGATGATGATGAAGAAGPAGPAGVAGAPGTANVIYSGWLDVAFTADTVHNGTVVDTVGFYSLITAAKLTSAILNTGEIKVYVNLDASTDPTVVPLPYLDVYSGLSISPSFYLTSGVGTIQLYSNANVGTVTSQGIKYQQYRYILIPGGTTARSAVDWNNYKAVKAYLNLKD